MIASRYRFHGHGSLRYVYKNSQAIRSRHLVFRVVTNNRRKTSRVSVVVSKKVHKSAVGRNRIRRRIYEIIRHELPQFRTNFDIVILVVSAEVRTMETVELYRSIRQLGLEAGLYKIGDTSDTL